MKPLFFLFLFFSSLQGISQVNDRTVEVTGHASKKFLADLYYITVTVKGNGQCEIPSGKHYQKYIKECKENNKKVVASRVDILNGIVNYFGTRVKKKDLSSSSSEEVITDFSGDMAATAAAPVSEEYLLSKSYLLEFSTYADALELINILKDYKGMLDPGVLTASCTKLTPNDMENIKLESLKDARRKAEAMALTLQVELGDVKNIYEEKPVDNSWLQYLGGSSSVQDITPDYMPSSWRYRNEGSIPDDEGKLTFSQTSFVRFYLVSKK